MYDALIDWEKRTGVHLDGIVHVGDFGVDRHEPQWRHLWDVDKEVPIETWVCMGNHEDYSSIEEWMNEPDRIARLHLLPDGGVTDVLGIQVASLWGNYSPRSWMVPERVRLSRKHKEPGNFKAMHIYRPSVFKLMDHEGQVDVLITHDCSSVVVPKDFGGKPVPAGLRAVLGLDADEVAPPGCPGITQLLNKFSPQYHFYGHFHVRDYREVGGTKVICLNAFDQKPSEAVEVVEFKR